MAKGKGKGEDRGGPIDEASMQQIAEVVSGLVLEALVAETAFVAEDEGALTQNDAEVAQVAEDEGNVAQRPANKKRPLEGFWVLPYSLAERAQLEVGPTQYVVEGKFPRCVYSLLGPRRTEEEHVKWEELMRKRHMLQLDEDGAM